MRTKALVQALSFKMLLESGPQDIDDLYFDFSSPRYKQGEQIKDEEEQLRFFLKKCSKNLILSVGSYGAQNSFSAIRFKKGFMLLDGNKRLAILKALRNPALVKEFSLSPVNPIAIAKVNVYQSKRSCLEHMLSNNLPQNNAYLNWSMSELRNFLHICFEQESDLGDLSKLLNMEESKLRELISCVNFSKKIKLDEYDLSIQRNYSSFYAFLSSEKFLDGLNMKFDKDLSVTISEVDKIAASQKAVFFLNSLKEEKKPAAKADSPKKEVAKKLKLKDKIVFRKQKLSNWASSLKAPIAASIVFHIVLVLLLGLFVVTKYIEKKKELKVTMADQEKELTLDVPEQEKVENPELEKISAESLQADNINLNEILSDNSDKDDLEAEHSEVVDKLSTEIPIKNISISVNSGGRQFLSNRSLIGKTKAVREYGGSATGQDRLIKALEWLKRNQNPDGSWCNSQKHSMTGLATLAFLAYGVDGNSKRYGRTLIKAIKWMVSESQKDYTMLGSSGYEHAIATFSLAEACCIITKKELRDAMEKNLEIILNGQNEDGGYDYDYSGDGDSVLTLTGWNTLAIKAAKISGSTNSKLSDAMYKMVSFYKSRQQEEGFCYRDGFLGDNSGGCGIGSARGIGVLGLQVLNAGRAKEIHAPLKAMLIKDTKKLNWNNDEPLPLYSWYYMTQAMFNAGGQYWVSWRNRFQSTLIKNQHRDGYWDHPPNSQYSAAVNPGISKVFNTSLGCLMLTVFYRYLPMYKQTYENAAKPKEDEMEEGLNLIVD